MSKTPKYHMEVVFSPKDAHPDDAHSVLMRLIPAGSRVLELGCASGYLSGYMTEVLECHVTGLELDERASELAAKHCSVVYQADLDAADVLQLAKENAPYDVLLAAAVLEHLKNPQRLLRETRSLLSPGAIVIVSLPNIAHWQFRLKLLLGKFDYEDYGVMDRTHLHLYTAKTGRELLEECGYDVQAIHIAGSLLQNIINGVARFFKQSSAPLLLPGLFAYELIYVAVAKGE